MLTVLTNIRSTKMLHYASCIMHCRQEAEIWYVDCSHKCKMNQGVMVGGRRPLVEDDLLWKTTFGGRRPSMEDDLRWKMTFCGRRPLVEDDLWWKTAFDGRRPLVEDNLWWKTTFGGRRPLVEDDLR